MYVCIIWEIELRWEPWTELSGRILIVRLLEKTPFRHSIRIQVIVQKSYTALMEACWTTSSQARPSFSRVVWLLNSKIISIRRGLLSWSNLDSDGDSYKDFSGIKYDNSSDYIYIPLGIRFMMRMAKTIQVFHTLFASEAAIWTPQYTIENMLGKSNSLITD